ncbi:DUF6882 domain-containing protein [Aquimarina sp. BL5]|uniref:DUF6882 domain-containing protein n=1 Tax=Aquimarina sp. BL5 TaxID=1714860 RepID=UPI000EA8F3AC|nr:DUF6882 domain-containing protein [Aquimarina sp. BL5]
MQKSTLTIILIMLSFFSKGQSNLETRFSEANSDLSLRNMYQRIVWNMQPTNEYLFDQTKGEVKYIIEENGYEVIAIPKILGTFNLDDKTFLWADKNSSINKNLNDKVDSFRETLPKKYQKNKFKSDTDFIKDLLSLFSFHIDANGFDNQRQDNTIIYYSLLEISIFKNGKEIKVIKPKNHIQVLENTNNISRIREFHKEKLAVNKLYNDGEIESDEAFKRIKEVHLKYWLNEDTYFFPSLSWPCDFDEKSILKWLEFKTNDNRYFVMYTTDLGWTTESYAYEIDVNEKGDKTIINEY